MNKQYQATLDFLYRQLPMYQRLGSTAFKKDLGNIKKLSKALGNPHTKLRCIHIAGTNGKGSTAHILSAILQSAGFKTGLYTSPHYRDFRERIKIDGQLVPEKWIIDFVEQNQAFFKDIQPSFFEITVAMAFQYFVEEQVDIAIIETGLGGRLDSTNIIDPLISIITNISLDHQSMLGDTLPLIAGEKAGIMKSKVPVVIGERQEETEAVFEEAASRLMAPLYYVDQQLQVKKKRSLPFHTSFDIYLGNKLYLKNLKVNLTGHYQQANLATALTALQILEQHQLLGASIKETDIREGLENLQSLTYFLGRWQKIAAAPLTICDSAHNEGGLKQVFQQLRKMRYEKLHFVFGTVNDKSLKDLLPLFPKEATYYFCKANIPRGRDAKDLQQEARAHDLFGRSYISVKNALKAAQRKAGEKDLIFIGGSIFVVAEVVK